MPPLPDALELPTLPPFPEHLSLCSWVSSACSLSLSFSLLLSLGLSSLFPICFSYRLCFTPLKNAQGLIPEKEWGSGAEPLLGYLLAWEAPLGGFKGEGGVSITAVTAPSLPPPTQAAGGPSSAETTAAPRAGGPDTAEKEAPTARPCRPGPG